MACAQSGAVVAVEVLVEQDVVAPVGIALEFLRATIDGTPAMLVAGEDPGEPVGDLFAHLEQVHHLPGTCGAFDFEVVAVIEIEVPERPDDEQVDRHPDRSPPVGVAAEHAGVRLGRQVVHAVLLAAYVQDERMLLVELGERADSIGAQELVLVEHLGEDPAQPFRVEQGRDPALGYTKMSRARGVDGLLEFGYPPQAFIHSSHRPRDTLPHRLFENRRRAQGQEAHH